MPNAKLRQELNEAYAFAATFARSRTPPITLVEGLVENGFEQFEARAAIREAEFEGFQAGREAYFFFFFLWRSKALGKSSGRSKQQQAGVSRSTPPTARFLCPARSEPERTTLTLTLYPNKPDIERIARRLYLKSRGARLVARDYEEAKPAFRVPLLAVKVGDLFEPFEKD